MEKQSFEMSPHTLLTSEGNAPSVEKQQVVRECSMPLGPVTGVGSSLTPFSKIHLVSFAKWMCCLLMFVLVACGGSLSDDQRKKLREEIEDYKITQVSDADIVTAAMDEGQKIFETLKKSGFSPSSTDRLSRERKVRIRYIKPGTGDAMEVENQIIQAYIVGSATGATQDNIQKLRSGTTTSLQDYDTLLYSRPVVTSLPDGSVNVEGVWNIYVSKREIVRVLSKK